jgi:hypothetical protein
MNAGRGRPRRRPSRGPSAVLTVLAVSACAAGSTAPEARPPGVATIDVKPWPAADALFRGDPRWAGGDGVYSVDLGEGRVLWLFADSFVRLRPGRGRQGSRMVRNSLAIQHGYDPARATLRFYWGGEAGEPASFFPDGDDLWYWPGAGVRLDSTLLLFLMKVRPSDEGLGFEVSGWTAALVSNPGDEPDRWDVRWLDTPANPLGVVVGSASVLRHRDHLYAYGTVEPPRGVHLVHLVRWPLARAAAGDLSAPEWWAGETAGWVRDAPPGAELPPVFSGAQTEFTVHPHAGSRGFLQVQTSGFGAAELSFRWSPRLTGPWPAPRRFFRPPEADRPDAFIYQGKAHPHLRGAPLVLTYTVNTTAGLGTLVSDTSLYYPRFLRGSVRGGSSPRGGGGRDAEVPVRPRR